MSVLGKHPWVLKYESKFAPHGLLPEAVTLIP